MQIKEKCKLKPQCDIISHLSEWPSSINQQTASAGEAVEKGDPRALSRGMQTGAATVGNSMESPQKIKTGTGLWTSDSTSGYVSKETWHPEWKERVHPCVHCSVIYDSQRVEAAPGPSDRWADGDVVHAHSGRLLSYNRVKSCHLRRHTRTQRLRCPVKSVRGRWTPCDVIYVWNLKNKVNECAEQKQTHGYREHSDGCQTGGGLQGLGEEVKGLRSAARELQNHQGDVQSSTGSHYSQ